MHKPENCHLGGRRQAGWEGLVLTRETGARDSRAAHQSGHACGSAIDRAILKKLHDIGIFLRQRIADHFAAEGLELNLKYIDPSYAIRSVEANPFDSVYCLRLAQNAIHAAMAGRTEMAVGRWRGRYAHIPMHLAVSHRNQVCPDGDLWLSVLEATGQPPVFG